MTWRERARAVIQRETRAWLAENGLTLADLPRLSAEQTRALVDRCNNAYPWGERARHPYRAWLREMRDLRLFPTRHRAASPGGVRRATPPGGGSLVLDLEWAGGERGGCGMVQAWNVENC